jgi:hypothetical protein
MSTPENLTQVEQSLLDLKIRKYNFALAVMNAFIIYVFFYGYVVFLFSTMCSIRTCVKAIHNNYRDAGIGHGGGRDGNAIEKRRWANKI